MTNTKQMWILLVLACLVVSLHAERMIIGGEEAPKDQYSYVVSLRQSVNGETICGGVLISSSHVLTAAHCYGYSPTYASIGSHNFSGLNDGGEHIKIKRHYIHPCYRNMTLTHDFMLLELVTDSDLQPLEMIKPVEKIEPDQEVTVLGWGNTKNGEDSMSLFLKRVNMKIWEQEACEIRHEHIDHSMMCAGGVKNRDACGGDSGGPVIAKNNGKDVLVGIVSWGADECGEEGVPGVYARVTHALNFIYFHIPSLANTTSTP